jgi:hypothetical protein
MARRTFENKSRAQNTKEISRITESFNGEVSDLPANKLSNGDMLQLLNVVSYGTYLKSRSGITYNTGIPALSYLNVRNTGALSQSGTTLTSTVAFDGNDTGKTIAVKTAGATGLTYSLLTILHVTGANTATVDKSQTMTATDGIVQRPLNGLWYNTYNTAFVAHVEDTLWVYQSTAWMQMFKVGQDGISDSQSIIRDLDNLVVVICDGVYRLNIDSMLYYKTNIDALSNDMINTIVYPPFSNYDGSPMLDTGYDRRYTYTQSRITGEYPALNDRGAAGYDLEHETGSLQLGDGLDYKEVGGAFPTGSTGTDTLTIKPNLKNMIVKGNDTLTFTPNNIWTNNNYYFGLTVNGVTQTIHFTPTPGMIGGFIILRAAILAAFPTLIFTTDSVNVTLFTGNDTSISYLTTPATIPGGGVDASLYGYLHGAYDIIHTTTPPRLYNTSATFYINQSYCFDMIVDTIQTTIRFSMTDSLVNSNLVSAISAIYPQVTTTFGGTNQITFQSASGDIGYLLSTTAVPAGFTDVSGLNYLNGQSVVQGALLSSSGASNKFVNNVSGGDDPNTHYSIYGTEDIWNGTRNNKAGGDPTAFAWLDDIPFMKAFKGSFSYYSQYKYLLTITEGTFQDKDIGRMVNIIYTYNGSKYQAKEKIVEFISSSQVIVSHGNEIANASTNLISAWHTKTITGMSGTASVTCYSVLGTKIWLGTSEGLFYSADSGATWSEIWWQVGVTHIIANGIISKTVSGHDYTFISAPTSVSYSGYCIIDEGGVNGVGSPHSTCKINNFAFYYIGSTPVVCCAAKNYLDYTHVGVYYSVLNTTPSFSWISLSNGLPSGYNALLLASDSTLSGAPTKTSLWCTVGEESDGLQMPYTYGLTATGIISWGQVDSAFVTDAWKADVYVSHSPKFIYYDPVSANLFILRPNLLLKSANGTATPVDISFPGTWLKSFNYSSVFIENTRLFITTNKQTSPAYDGAVYVSDDMGGTWQDFQSSTITSPSDINVIFAIDVNNMIIGTNGAGAYLFSNIAPCEIGLNSRYLFDNNGGAILSTSGGNTILTVIYLYDCLAWTENSATITRTTIGGGVALSNYLKVGNQVFLSDGQIGVIKSFPSAQTAILAGVTAPTGSAAAYLTLGVAVQHGYQAGVFTANTGLSADYFDSYCDNWTDDEVSPRIGVMGLKTRFMRSLPDSSIGELISGFLIVSGGIYYYYSELPLNNFYLLGNYNPNNQVDKVLEEITCFTRHPSLLGIMTATKSYQVQTNLAIDLTDTANGTIVRTLPQATLIDGNCGCAGINELVEVEAGTYAVLLPLGDIRSFNGYTFSDSFTIDKIQHKINNLTDRTIDFDIHYGLIVRGTNKTTSVQEMYYLALSKSLVVGQGQFQGLPFGQFSIHWLNVDNKTYMHDLTYTFMGLLAYIDYGTQTDVDQNGTLIAQISGAITTKDDTGTTQHYFIEHLEGHVYISPEPETASLAALNTTVSAFNDIGTLVDTQSGVVTDIDINYTLKVRGHRIRYQFAFDRSGWLLTGIVNYYKSVDQRNAVNVTNVENVGENIVESPIFGLGRHEKMYDICSGNLAKALDAQGNITQVLPNSLADRCTGADGLPYTGIQATDWATAGIGALLDLKGQNLDNSTITFWVKAIAQDQYVITYKTCGVKRGGLILKKSGSNYTLTAIQWT